MSTIYLFVVLLCPKNSKENLIELSAFICEQFAVKVVTEPR